eukprot:102273_1
MTKAHGLLKENDDDDDIDDDNKEDEYNDEIYIEQVSEQKIEEDEFNSDRYTTDLGLYGFGMDYDYSHLQQFKGNKSLKDEMFNSKWISLDIWDRELNKAFKKLKMIIKNRNYQSKQYSKPYGIVRGQPMSLHQILVICFYTDISQLCTDYRSTFRRTDADKTEESVRIRHCKYYFFSRFLFTAIEFYGDIMKDNDLVYHGLDQPFLFSDFLTHFNAPTSTTPSKVSASNFAKDGGIIMALKNGNDDINTNRIISQYEPSQPRYLDVSWISDFAHEQEYLFYGNNIIFKIHEIIHKEIPKHTLKHLNLLQETIENKPIDWDKIPKRVNKLCERLIKIREMNLELLLSENEVEQKEISTDEEIDKKDNLIASMTETEFIEFAQKLLTNKEVIEKYKWTSGTDVRTKAINAFKIYCAINQVNGSIFGEVSRKLMTNWMKREHKIIPVDSLKIHTILKKEIAEYEAKILGQIEDKEKQKTEEFEVEYYLKLFHYFTICRRDFVCIHSVFDMPQVLKNILLVSDDNINKIKDDICLTKLTDIFSNVYHIAFTEI